jgi:hypothetical protein
MTNRSLRTDQPTARQLLARILDEPSLVATIQELPPRALGKLIEHVGLEDCGEIIALATTEQLRQIFDDDLWRSDRPGQDEAFDAERFGLWLEVMLEAGEDFVVQKLMELPLDLVTLAFHRHVLVLSIDQLQAEMEESEDAERIDKALEGYQYEEFDEYQVISRRHAGWDSIVTILIALDKEDHAFLDRILERCCDLSSATIEDNGGLYEVLTSEEMLETDLAADREDRRAAEGFVAPSQAASFLALCRSTPPDEVLARPRDAVTRAYFRELAPAPTAQGNARAVPSLGLERALAELDVGDVPRAARPVFLLEGRSGTTGDGSAIFRTALASLHDSDPKRYAERVEELAYLANVLVAGHVVDGRAVRPFEAVVIVAEVCNLGLEHLATMGHAKESVAERALTLLSREGADKAFRVGWWLLHGQAAPAR